MVDYGYMLLRDIGLVSWRGWACALLLAPPTDRE
jgi:hypothetical protein